jgi:tetratricopeptide (TPR) repeat protein
MDRIGLWASRHARPVASDARSLRIELLNRAGRPAEAIRAAGAARDDLNTYVALRQTWTRFRRGQLLARLAQCHQATGDLDTARATAELAVADLRRCAPQADALLAWTLRLLATLERQQGRTDEADAHESQAVRLAAVMDSPEDLIQLLSSRTDRLWQAGDRQGSAAATADLLGHLRRYAAEQPTEFAPRLARILAVESGRRREVGSTEAAISLAEEGIAAARRVRDDAALARCLEAHAQALAAAGRLQEAADEALTLWRPLADDPDERALLARTLRLLGDCLRRRGWYEEAVAPYAEAVAILHTRPEFPASFIKTLHDYALALSNVHRHAEAIDTMTESKHDAVWPSPTPTGTQSTLPGAYAPGRTTWPRSGACRSP